MPHTIATQNEKSDTKIEEDDGKRNEGIKRAECRVRRRDRRPANNKQDEKDGK